MYKLCADFIPAYSANTENLNLAENLNFNFKYFDLIPGIALEFSIEPLGLIFACLISVMLPPSLLYLIGYLRANNEPRQNIFITCYVVASFSAIFMAFSDNLLTLFIFYEFITLSTYPLVIHKLDKNSIDSGRTYLYYLLGSSLILFLPLIIITYNLCGSLEFLPEGIIQNNLSQTAIVILLLLYVFAIAKAAIMPMHNWLIKAMVAPHPVSALLHGLVVVKAGIFAIVKISAYIFGSKFLYSTSDSLNSSGFAHLSNALFYISGFTIITAAFYGIFQNNLKQMLAYSTISQLSYPILAISLNSPDSVSIAMLFMIGHSMAKIILFNAAGQIYSLNKIQKISDLSAIGSRTPITTITMVFASLFIMGMPFMQAKTYLLDRAVYFENISEVIIIAIATVITSIYIINFIFNLCLASNTGKVKSSKNLLIKELSGPNLYMSLANILIMIYLILFIFNAYKIRNFLVE